MGVELDWRFEMETSLESSGNRVQRKRWAQKAGTGRDRGVAGSSRWVVLSYTDAPPGVLA